MHRRVETDAARPARGPSLGLAMVLTLAATACAMLPVSFAAAQAPTTTRASLSSTGAEGAGFSLGGDVTADGRLVAFASSSDGLVGGDANGTLDVYLRDRLSGETRRMSSTPAGQAGNSFSTDPSLSADGRLLLFRTGATNLVAGAPSSLLLADTATGTLRRAVTQAPGHGPPYDASLSDDGTRIVFAANRTPDGTADVFAADVATGTVRRLSETAAGLPGNGFSYEPDVSGDGRWLAFTTAATNLVTPDGNGFRDIVLVDLATGTKQRASVGSGTPGAESNLHSSDAALSRDGCIVAFRSDASNLVTPDAGPGVTEAFARDRCSAQTSLVSVSNAGTAGTAFVPDVSDDGCLVAYRSSTVSPGPSSGLAAVLRDRCAGATSRLDLSTSGEPGNADVQEPRISPGTGRYVTFTTAATNLVAGDGNGAADVFVRDRAVNARPVAELTLAQDGRRVTASAAASRDPDGPTLTGIIAWGDGSPDAVGLQAQHEYARGGSYAVTVTVTDGDGATTSRTVPVTVPDPPAPGPPAPAPGGGPVPRTVDPPRLVLDRVSIRRPSFAVVPRGKRAGGRRGATLQLRLSEAAAVALSFQRATSGRRSAGRCRPGARRGARCTRYGKARTLRRALGGGTRRITLTGRVGSATLARGRHRLRVSARTADGRRSSVRTLTITITRGR